MRRGVLIRAEGLVDQEASPTGYDWMKETSALLVLQVLQGPDRGKRFELPAHEPQLIGRSSESLPITDTTVSRRHAELTPDDGVWWLRDLESANGTFVNGQKIADRLKLSPGDQIRCGSTLLIFALAGETDQRRDGGSGGRGTSTIHMMDADSLEVTVESIAANPSADSIRAAGDHLRVIYELTALTASIFDRDELLTRVLDLIFDEFKPDRGFILLGSDPRGPLDDVAVRYAVRPKTIDEGRIPVSRTIIETALESGEGILSTNAMNDTRFRSGDSVRDYGIRSAICVPIIARNRRLGVIHIDSQLAEFTFTEAQLRLLNAIGRHTGLALISKEMVASKVQTERLAAIGQTVASLSHSIKNILQGLRGGADAVELALNRGDLELAREGWPILTRNLDRILTLTLNMLAYSRESHLDLELADPHALIQEVAAMVNRECERKRVGLITDLADDVPPIAMDVNGIHQALTNVMMNAVEAVPPKRGIVTVRTAYDADAHRATIQVIDNGPGIERSRIESVFEAFNSTKGQRGTGLGLAVSRKIIEDHGGTIALESTVGEGTTVTIVLPSDHDLSGAGDTAQPHPMSFDDADENFAPR